MPQDKMVIALVVLFMAVVACAIVYGLLDWWKKERKMREEIRSLGFSPVPQPDDPFREIVLNHHQLTDRKDLVLKNVFLRREPGYRVYFYDLLDNSGESSTYYAYGSLLVVSEKLDLPRLSIGLRMEEGGFWGRLASAAVNALTAGGVEKVDFSHHPEFDRQYRVRGMKDAAIRRVLTPDILDVFAEKPYRFLTAEGRVFAYGRLADDPYKPRVLIGPSAPKSLDQRDILKEALEIYRLLSEERPDHVQEPPDDETREE